MFAQRHPGLPLQVDFDRHVAPKLNQNRIATPLQYGDENLGWWITDLRPIPMLKRKSTGCCPDCQQRVYLRTDGTVTAHVIKKDCSCTGAGKQPVSDSVKVEDSK